VAGRGKSEERSGKENARQQVESKELEKIDKGGPEWLEGNALSVGTTLSAASLRKSGTV
jgi:hypothetical protein